MEDTNAYNNYIAALFAPQDPALTETLAHMEQEGVPGINVSATEGKLLHVLALTVGAKRILEVGTLGGYSGITRYNAQVALHPQLVTIIMPILRQHGIDGLTVSYKRTRAAPGQGGTDKRG